MLPYHPLSISQHSDTQLHIAEGTYQQKQKHVPEHNYWNYKLCFKQIHSFLFMKYVLFLIRFFLSSFPSFFFVIHYLNIWKQNSPLFTHHWNVRFLKSTECWSNCIYSCQYDPYLWLWWNGFFLYLLFAFPSNWSSSKKKVKTSCERNKVGKNKFNKNWAIQH